MNHHQLRSQSLKIQPSLGRRVELLRERYGWTQQQLAERVAVTEPFISYIESGLRTPSLNTLVRFSRVLRCSLDYLVTGLPTPNDARLFHNPSPVRG